MVTGAVQGVLPPSAGWPVLLAYHGGNETSVSFIEYSDIGNLSCVVIAPLGQDSVNVNAWIGAFPLLYQPPRDDAAFVNEVLRDVSKRFPLDYSRIYIAGKSDGGGMAAYEVLFPDLFEFEVRGISTVSAAFYGIHNKVAPATVFRFPASAKDYPNINIPKKKAGVALLDFHGTGDTVMPYQGGYDNSTTITEAYNQPGNFFAKAQGFVSRLGVNTANILAYFARWAEISNGIEQEAEVQPFLVADGNFSQPQSIYLFTWSSPDRQPIQHVQVPGGQHCWYGHPTSLHNCSSDLNNEIDATYIMANYFDIPVLSPYESIASTTEPTVSLHANPSGLIDLSYQQLVAPNTTIANITALLWQASKQYPTSYPYWQMGFFEVLNMNGDVLCPKTGSVLSPIDKGWLAAALNPTKVILLPDLSEPSSVVSFSLMGNKIYSSFVHKSSSSLAQTNTKKLLQGISTPFSSKRSKLQVIDLGTSSFAYQKVGNKGQVSGDRIVFLLEEMTLM